MIENKHPVRVDVDKRGIATTDGGQVGDSEEQVKQVYGPRLKIEPHHYTDGHYLTVQNGNYGVRFETDKGLDFLRRHLRGHSVRRRMSIESAAPRLSSAWGIFMGIYQYLILACP